MELVPARAEVVAVESEGAVRLVQVEVAVAVAASLAAAAISTD